MTEDNAMGDNQMTEAQLAFKRGYKAGRRGMVPKSVFQKLVRVIDKQSKKYADADRMITLQALAIKACEVAINFLTIELNNETKTPNP